MTLCSEDGRVCTSVTALSYTTRCLLQEAMRYKRRRDPHGAMGCQPAMMIQNAALRKVLRRQYSDVDKGHEEWEIHIAKLKAEVRGMEAARHAAAPAITGMNIDDLFSREAVEESKAPRAGGCPGALTLIPANSGRALTYALENRHCVRMVARYPDDLPNSI